MQNKEIMKKCKETINLLDSYNIPGAFSLIEALSRERHDFKTLDSLARLRETYRYMAEYMLAGAEDPSRQNVYYEIIEKLRSIVDLISREIISVDSSDSYYETYRFHKLTEQSIDTLLALYSAALSDYQLATAAENDSSSILKKIEELHTSIFNAIWVSLDDKRMAEACYEIVESEKYGEWLPSHIISALTLSLNGFFDRHKLLALLKIYQSNVSEKISARALVGIILTLARYPERIKNNREISAYLQMMTDSLLDYSRVRQVIINIIRTRDTDRISAKMKEEVLPEIMKLQPDILKKLREASPDSMDNAMGLNPEWEEMLEKSGLSQKMREFSDLQNDGADLMMVAFSNLKQFPFFYAASNWFLPFFSSHPAITGGEKEKKIIDKLMEIGKNVCDSDKYSLAISLGKMPEVQKDMMLSQLDSQFSQISEELKEKSLRSSNPEFDEEVTKVVRDLYRFFRLFRKRQGFFDPFESTFPFLDIPFIGDMMSDSEIVLLVAEFYFSRKYYQEALPLFNLLIEDAPEDSSLWEKAGVCYMGMKFYEKALECFSKAELLKTSSRWLLENLAFVNKKQGNFNRACEYYSKLLEKDSENLSLILNAAYCSFEAGQIERALKHYYHANYLDQDNLKILRAIAWSEFINREFEKSEKYYLKILENSSDSLDFLNVGHLYLAQGDMKKALEFYNKASENYSEFRDAFIGDLETLRKFGLEEESLRILLDYIGLNK